MGGAGLLGNQSLDQVVIVADHAQIPVPASEQVDQHRLGEPCVLKLVHNDPTPALVSHNEHRTRKALIAVRGPGGQVQVVGLANEYQEAHWVAGQIAEALAAGTPPTEILAVARTGYATVPLQHALAHHGIAHRVLGSLGLYERTEVRDAFAYLTLVSKPARCGRLGGLSARHSAASGRRRSHGWSPRPVSGTGET